MRSICAEGEREGEGVVLWVSESQKDDIVAEGGVRFRGDGRRGKVRRVV
jgi:hypothetical protein